MVNAFGAVDCAGVVSRCDEDHGMTTMNDQLTVTRDDVGDDVCQHGTAMDVHCCGCHSGFLFDLESCTCLDGEDDDDTESLGLLLPKAHKAIADPGRPPQEEP